MDTDLFWSHVDTSGPCWIWTGSINRGGYGSVGIRADGKWIGSFLPHRVAYELAIGPIPEGMTLDHLCREKRCVRPDHLEPVSIGINVNRAYRAKLDSLRCEAGHKFHPGRTRYRLVRECLLCEEGVD